MKSRSSKLSSAPHYNFRYALLIISVFGYLCCPDRSDFNVPLGLFSFLLWGDHQFSHKPRIIYLLLLSVVGDVLWIIFVGFIKWSLDEHANQAAKAMHQLTRIVSILNVVYKIGLVIYATQRIQACRDIFSAEMVSKEIKGERST